MAEAADRTLPAAGALLEVEEAAGRCVESIVQREDRERKRKGEGRRRRTLLDVPEHKGLLLRRNFEAALPVANHT